MKLIPDSVHKGDIYQLDDGDVTQYIQFMTIKDGVRYRGTTNEELIDVLIDRLSKLNDRMPCVENVNSIAMLGMAKNWLERRQQRVTKERNEINN